MIDDEVVLDVCDNGVVYIEGSESRIDTAAIAGWLSSKELDVLDRRV